MTLPSTPRRAGPYVGNLVTTSFPFGFKAFSPGDVTVVRRVGDSETILTYGVNYGVTLNADQDQFPGGYVLYPVGDEPMPASESITIISSIPYNQQTKLPSGGQFRPQVIENAFDRIVAQIQQLAEQNARQVGMPVSYSGSELKLPFPQPGKLLAWNNGATGLINVDSDILVNVAGFATWHSKSFTGGGSSFDLEDTPGTIDSLMVVVDGLVLDKATDYTLNGTVLTINGGTPADSKVFTRWGEVLPENGAIASLTKYKFPSGFSLERDVASKLDEFATIRDYLSIDNGTVNASAALEKALEENTVVRITGGSWRFDDTVNIPSGRLLLLEGAAIIANTGVDALFSFPDAREQLAIVGYGSTITGNAGSVLFCSGSTYTPTNAGQYARQIRLVGLNISSENITRFLHFDKAVRQVFVDSCMAYTRNGIDANGKNVECYFHKCIIYGATEDAGTYGVRLRSPGGTSFYNEGWEFFGCTIDHFDNTFDVTDIFNLNVVSGFIGCKAGGYSAVFGAPTTNLCADIKFTGVPIAGKVRFVPAGGLDYAATFNGCTSLLCEGINIELANNAAGISIRGHKFRSSTGGVPVVCQNNNANIVIDGIDCDGTFIGGPQFKGAAGPGCSISNMQYAGSGDSLYLERTVLISNIPINSAAVALYVQQFNTNSIQGSKAVAASIASIASGWAKDETGEVVIELSCSGMATDGSQRFDVNGPAGMVFPSGTGWTAGSFHHDGAAGRISHRIPYRCTQDVVGTIELLNAAGNTVNVNFHSYFGIVRNH